MECTAQGHCNDSTVHRGRTGDEATDEVFGGEEYCLLTAEHGPGRGVAIIGLWPSLSYMLSYQELRRHSNVSSEVERYKQKVCDGV